MSLLINEAERISAFITNKGWTKPKIILALSGGPDSVFLFYVLLHLKKLEIISLVCLHVNHGWRAFDKEEEAFCRILAIGNLVPIIVNYASEVDIKKTGSLEEYGRKIRMHFFHKARVELAAQVVCTAHNQDDFLETFFIKIIRGSSLSGLGGILEFHSFFYRPLLNLPKAEISAYLRESGLSFCLDESNDSDLFLRNRIRHKLIPSLEGVDIRARSKLVSTMKFLQQESDLLEYLILEKFQALVGHDGDVVFLDLEKFLLLPEFLQKKLVQLLLRKAFCKVTESQALFSEIIRFIKNKKSRSHNICDFVIKKVRNKLYIKFNYKT